MKKNFFLLEMVWEGEKSQRKLISRKKDFLPLSGEIFFSGWGLTKNEKKFFLLEMVWEGEKTHRKLISRRKIFLPLSGEFFFRGGG